MADKMDLSTIVTTVGDGVAVRVKVVPGASRTKVAGVLGDRLKVAVAAAAEGGRANRAVCDLLGKTLGVATRDVVIAAGQTQPRKTVHVLGVTTCEAVERLRAALDG